MTVIPDQIEPVEGWKGWQLGQDGKLYSQSGSFVWEPGERVEAKCGAFPAVHRGWFADREPNGDEAEPVTQPGIGFQPHYVVATSSVHHLAAMPSIEIERIPEPEIVLPYPLRWFFRETYETHEAPCQGCSCGIYMADDKDEASSYGSVVGKIAGWGTVVKHGRGARAQYAYPTELHVTAEQAERIADYGVPLVLTEEPTIHAAFSTAFASPSRWPWFVSAAVGAALAITNVAIVATNGSWINAGAAAAIAFSSGVSLKKGLR